MKKKYIFKGSPHEFGVAIKALSTDQIEGSGRSFCEVIEPQDVENKPEAGVVIVRFYDKCLEWKHSDYFPDMNVWPNDDLSLCEPDDPFDAAMLGVGEIGAIRGLSGTSELIVKLPHEDRVLVGMAELIILYLRNAGWIDIPEDEPEAGASHRRETRGGSGMPDKCVKNLIDEGETRGQRTTPNDSLLDKRHYLTELRLTLAERFSEGELRNLCFDLGVDYDDLRGEGKADKARELVEYCNRRNCIAELARAIKRWRQDITLRMPPPEWSPAKET